MATTGVGFRWLDLLEKEFDKACVELDTSISDLDTEDGVLTFGARQKIATLSSCFAQLTHKALTIFQHSAKLELEVCGKGDIYQRCSNYRCSNAVIVIKTTILSWVDYRCPWAEVTIYHPPGGMICNFNVIKKLHCINM